jgi:dienelactone hydrolase
MLRISWALSAIAALAAPAETSAQAPRADSRVAISPLERAAIESMLSEVEKALAELKATPAVHSNQELAADVAITHKAAAWALKFGEFYTQNDASKAADALRRGLERASQLKTGAHPWTSARGGTVRGFTSRVDGSIQPYAIYVSDAYSDATPTRLDVILHGRGATLTEVNFFERHDGKPYPKDESGLVLHIYGRGDNAYRWAGESDVFEAVEAVRRHYRVDPRRILLRGFSMGGAGAWHLGLHHPSLWCSVEAGAGFVETRKYAKLGSIPEHQARALHIYDSLDYASNARNTPIAGYGGEDDAQLAASVKIREALEQTGVSMTKDGLVTRADAIDFLHVVGAKTGHRVDPDSAKVLKSFRDLHAEKGLAALPKRIYLTTYTLKYNRAHWASVEALNEHYKPAVVDARRDDDVVIVDKIENVSILAVGRHAGETIRIGGAELPLRTAVKGLLPDVFFLQTEGGWQTLDYDQSRAVQQNARHGKRHGLQGPIDDAFTGPFLVVRGSGAPWNPRTHAWAEARLTRFVNDWERWMRGKVRVVSDSDVSAADLQNHHIVLFGDPGSNRLISEALPRLPIRWTRDDFQLGGHFPTANHAPALVALSPFSPFHYVVLNSGHTFGEKDFIGTNALLFPKVGDWAVFRVGDGLDDALKSGYFDELWKTE